MGVVGGKNLGLVWWRDKDTAATLSPTQDKSNNYTPEKSSVKQDKSRSKNLGLEIQKLVKVISKDNGLPGVVERQADSSN